MLKGCDISKWQKVTPLGHDFYVIRASCGLNADMSAGQHFHTIRDKPAGFYHYAKTNTDWLRSAQTFLRLVNQHTGGVYPVFLALDIESVDANRTNAVEWVTNWLAFVIRATGIHPLVYTSSSLVPKFAPTLISLNCGLWVAHWGVKKPKIAPLTTWAMWQYSDSKGKLDLDYFNGNLAQLKKYMGKVK